MKQSLLVLICFLTINTIQAQETVYFQKEENRTKSNKKRTGYQQNIIKISPLSFISGVVPVYYERAINSTFSVQVGAGITTRNYIREAVLEAGEGKIGTSKTVWSDGKTNEDYSNENFYDNTKDERKPALGYFVAIEPRVYFDDDGMEGSFIGLSLSRTNYKFNQNKVQTGTPTAGSVVFTNNKFAEFENFTDALVTFGNQVLYDKVSLEYNAGIGLRKINGKRYAYSQTGFGKYIDGETTYNKTNIAFNLSLKIGYHF
jgi:hypothetical protein